MKRTIVFFIMSFLALFVMGQDVLTPYREDLPTIDYRNQWLAYKHRCQVLSDSSSEDNRLFAVFVDNLHFAAEHNSFTRDFKSPGSERLGANCEAHYSYQEWRVLRGHNQRDAFLAVHPEPIPHDTISSYNAAKPRSKASRSIFQSFASKTCSSSTKSCDWRTKTGVVGAVQNQGQCGSCWAFAASEVIRSCNVVNYGVTSMPNLSAEQLLDCSQAEGNIYNCSSGYVAYGMQYVVNNGGVNSAINYPYTAENGTNSACISSLTTTYVASATQVRYVNQNSPSSMIDCAYNQPIAVNLAGGSRIFQLYVSGIISNATACGAFVDHSVLLVGWGTGAAPSNTPYWIVRNQWGTTWGMSGDAMIERDTTNGGVGMCAINVYPTFAYC